VSDLDLCEGRIGWIWPSRLFLCGLRLPSLASRLKRSQTAFDGQLFHLGETRTRRRIARGWVSFAVDIAPGRVQV
jgi:hypothetical protein